VSVVAVASRSSRERSLVRAPTLTKSLALGCAELRQSIHGRHLVIDRMARAGGLFYVLRGGLCS
jgi:hypothetical protein